MKLLGLSCILVAGAVTLGQSSALADDSFAGPTGLQAANLSLNPAKRARLHTEMSLHTQSAGSSTATFLFWTYGLGVKLTNSVRLGLPKRFHAASPRQ